MGAGLLLVVAGLVSGCGGDGSEPVVAPPLDTPSSEVPTFDASLEPAAAALALVPADDTALAVTDFTEIRLQLGFGDLTSESPARDRERFRQRADREAPLFDEGLLRPVDAQLRARYGFGQDDVDWEAQFRGPEGDGWVIKLRDDVASAGVTRAIDDGVGPLAGTDYYSTTHVILNGGTTDPLSSWRADPDLTALVGQVAATTYLSRSCLPFDVAFGPGLEGELAAAPAADVAALQDLGAFSVSFGTELVTGRLGPRRTDVFDRAELADTMPRTDPEFGLGYQHPVADPQGGRIGYTIGDPRTAARLAIQQHLPFAVCATTP